MSYGLLAFLWSESVLAEGKRSRSRAGFRLKEERFRLGVGKGYSH